MASITIKRVLGCLELKDGIILYAMISLIFLVFTIIECFFPKRTMILKYLEILNYPVPLWKLIPMLAGSGFIFCFTVIAASSKRCSSFAAFFLKGFTVVFIPVYLTLGVLFGIDIGKCSEDKRLYEEDIEKCEHWSIVNMVFCLLAGIIYIYLVPIAHSFHKLRMSDNTAERKRQAMAKRGAKGKVAKSKKVATSKKKPTKAPTESAPVPKKNTLELAELGQAEPIVVAHPVKIQTGSSIVSNVRLESVRET